VRNVVGLPAGHVLQEQSDGTAETDLDPDRDALSTSQQRFWAEFLERLQLDDPEQLKPKPARQGYVTFMLPAPGGSSWLTTYRNMKSNEVGVTLSSSRNSAGEFASDAIVSDWADIQPLLNGTARLLTTKDGRVQITDSLAVASLEDPVARRQAFDWLAEKVNTFVSVLRPRVRSAVADYQARGRE
jgi:hypothetical protein